VEKFECTRCHELPGFEPAPLNKHCVTCHQAIHEGTFEAPKKSLAKWQKNIVSLVYAPSLVATGKKLRRSWLESYLLEPGDLRPSLPATMPRLAITKDEAALIAELLVPGEVSDTFTDDNLDAGRTLYRQYKCSLCHAFTGSGEERAPATRFPVHLDKGRSLAPDLALTRVRFQTGALIPFLINPAAIQPGTAMPTHGLDQARARALATFILKAPLAVTGGIKEPVTNARVTPPNPTFDDVEKRVFKKICWHCHASPDYAMGDGGPGNTGGFGFTPRRLDLSSYEAVMSGALGPDGKRRSIFAKDESGESLLVRSLKARYAEEAGTPVPGIRGMPMGFPAMPMADIELIETWIKNGRPR
jgi:cytochrome c2